MKKLFIVLFLFTGAAGAYQLKWAPSQGAEGYAVAWAPLEQDEPQVAAIRERMALCPPCPQMRSMVASPGTDSTLVDTGSATSLDLNTLPLADGTRYSFTAYAYTGTPKSYSSPSDTIHWTKEPPPKIIEMPEAPKKIVITFGESTP